MSTDTAPVTTSGTSVSVRRGVILAVILVSYFMIVLDNSIIEDECIVAAGTVIPPRMHVPRRSLVRGNPGRIVRTLTDDDLLMIDGGVQAYLLEKEQFVREGIV